MTPGPKFNTRSGISWMFNWTGMSLPAPWDKSWSWNVSPDNGHSWPKGNAWEMESMITALQHEPLIPEEGEYLPPGSHWTAATPVTPYGEPWGNSEWWLPAPDGWGTYQANNFSEPWLLHLFLHRRAKFLNLRSCLLDLKFSISKSTGEKYILF